MADRFFPGGAETFTVQSGKCIVGGSDIRGDLADSRPRRSTGEPRTWTGRRYIDARVGRGSLGDECRGPTVSSSRSPCSRRDRVEGCQQRPGEPLWQRGSIRRSTTAVFPGQFGFTGRSRGIGEFARRFQGRAVVAGRRPNWVAASGLVLNRTPHLVVVVGTVRGGLRPDRRR